MNNNILVSIITVCYNSEKTIEQTIKSVLNQTYNNIEYIIIDGKSTDGTIQVAEIYIKKFLQKKINYSIFSESDKGIYDAMNKGIEKASGDLIGIINSDDWYEDNTVESVVKRYRETHCDLIFGDINMHLQNGTCFIKRAKKSKYITSRYWNHPTQFVDRKVYEKFKYPCKSISDDMDFYFKVIKEGYHIEVIHQILANFQMGGVSNKISINDVISRIKIRYQIYKNNGFSRLYLLECIIFEVVKFVLTSTINNNSDNI